MTFIGREQETRMLQSVLHNDKQENILIYGRRRVGKSELIKHTLSRETLPFLYYECKQTSELNNVNSLAALLAERDHLPPLAFASLEELLTFFFRQAEQKPQILVLDEYPYLRETVKGLDSILQTLIDTYGNHSKLKLILCGSYIDTMKNLVLAHNPLYGRITKVINLKPMDYFESSLFYPAFSTEDKVRLYSVFGGIPYYNKLVDEHLTVAENIRILLSAPGARLENEVAMYLHAELAKLNNANEVFDTLAKGNGHFSDLLSQSHISSSPTLTDILKRLMQMELVKKTAPINDENNRKRATYGIADNLALFYFRYLYRFSSQRNLMDPDTFYERYIQKDFEQSYVPNRFEQICAQYLIRKNRAGKIDPPFEKIGKYYYDLPKEHKNGEFDIVTLDEKGYIFYEAKFRNTPMTQAMVDQEISQVRQAGLPCYRFGFFSKAGFTAQKDGQMDFYTLEDLYENLN